eukprot:1864109-Rhodomonas_salina.1
MSDTEIGYVLRIHYAMSGADIGPSHRIEGVPEPDRSSSPVTPALCLHVCYGKSGTDLAYGSLSVCASAMRRPVLT